MRFSEEVYNIRSFQTIPNIAKDLMSRNYLLRKKAREELIEIGKPSLDVLVDLVKSKDETVRWEAMITIIQIGSEETLDILLKALEDEEFSIRWLAADGLVNLGKYAIRPILMKLMDNPDSAFIRRGAKHVLRELKKKGVFKDNYGLVETLANEIDHPNILLQTLKTINSIRIT
jgi:HEAT repeat protein